MAQPDARDAALVEAVCAAVTGLIIAARRGDQLAMIGELSQLLAAVTEFNATAERPADAALLRAIQMLSSR